jgi:hypothetical protein
MAPSDPSPHVPTIEGSWDRLALGKPERTDHLVDRACHPDSRFGWSRSISRGRPLYAIWRVRTGKRYLIHAYTVASDRWAIAREVRLARKALRMVMAGQYAFDREDDVVIKRFIRSAPRPRPRHR